jgi:hypothetical protein
MAALQGCDPDGHLQGSGAENTTPSVQLEIPGPLSGCDMVNGNTTYAPFTSCGTYDGSGQIPCTCSRAGQRVSEVFFKTAAERDHFLQVYPTSVPEYNGPTKYTNTDPYVFMLKFSY